MATTKKAKQKKVEVTTPVIVTYKGFYKSLKCRDFQYEIGKTYTHEGSVEACKSGFHACEYPLDVFNYYPPSGSRFAVVEQSGDLSRHGDDSKVASKSISIKAEIDFPLLVKAAIEYTTSRCTPIDKDSPASATGEQGAASATGEQGAASATGEQGAAMSSGYEGRARGIKGNAIFLVFRDDKYNIIHAKAAIVGRDGIKENTFYMLNKDGEFAEAQS